ncbi:hypothetical protein ACTQZS_02295 [Bilifractor sp. LCP19S3_H10]
MSNTVRAKSLGGFFAEKAGTFLDSDHQQGHVKKKKIKQKTDIYSI